MYSHCWVPGAGEKEDTFNSVVRLCDFPFAVPVIVSGNEPVAAAWVAVRESVALPGPVGVICVVIPVGVLETVSAGAPANVPVVEVLIVVDEEPP